MEERCYLALLGSEVYQDLRFAGYVGLETSAISLAERQVTELLCTNSDNDRFASIGSSKDNSHFREVRFRVRAASVSRLGFLPYQVHLPNIALIEEAATCFSRRHKPIPYSIWVNQILDSSSFVTNFALGARLSSFGS